MLDPIVHAALVTVFTFLVNLLFQYLGLDLGNEVAAGIAQFIVAYILSLFGYALWIRATVNSVIAKDRSYKPPLT